MLCCCTIIIIIIIYSRQCSEHAGILLASSPDWNKARASARVLCRRNIMLWTMSSIYTKWARSMHACIYGYEYILIGINIKTDARARVLFYTRRRSRRQTFTFQYILRSTRAHACFFFLLNNFIFFYFFFCCCGGSKQNQFITITFELRQHDFKI